MYRSVPFILGPVFCLVTLLLSRWIPLPLPAIKTLAVALWMITWWVTESAPIPVTALLPLTFFPLLGIMPMKTAASPYADPVIFLFMGGFFIALALEKHRLHERIALYLIRITGTSGNGIILGFLIATGGISMWISNTATAMMMLPMAMSVVNLLKKHPDQQIHHLDKAERNFALGLMLVIGYAATLGGMATIIGTPPNVVFVGLLGKFYGSTISFGDWMIVGVPVSITLLFMTYFIVTRILFPNGLKHIEGTQHLIHTRLEELGPVSREEKIVLFIFMLTSFLWIFQEPINLFAGQRVLNDTNVAMFGGILMFLVPTDLSKMQFLLTWKDTQKMQWGILLLFGGGMCMAEGLKVTGIIDLLGAWIAHQSTFSVGLILLLIILTVFLSEVMSNVALVQIFIPVIFGVANGLQVNPILLALPVTLAASVGFMLPIATPPNAIVYSSGYIRMKDMMKAGLFLNIVCILVILVASISLVEWVF